MKDQQLDSLLLTHNAEVQSHEPYLKFCHLKTEAGCLMDMHGP